MKTLAHRKLSRPSGPRRALLKALTTSLLRHEQIRTTVAKARELAREIASSAPLAVRWTKNSIYNGLQWSPAKAAEHEAHVQSRSMETEDFREGISALLSRREPKFVGK